MTSVAAIVASDETSLNSPAAPLDALPELLARDGALGQMLGRASASLAIPETARAIAIAALAGLSKRHPLVISCPTGTMAGQLYDDLIQYLPADEVELFPAWETLPFERVSPSVETMGRRLRTLHRLTLPKPPTIIVSSIRALLQRLGTYGDEAKPITIRPGDTVDPDELMTRLVTMGYRREELAEHRGEVAKRGAIIDVFPSTADTPIRIDLWGDEVDRLTEFSVSDQRSTDPIDEVQIFAARELIPSAATRQRAEELIAEEPWGREQWERLSEGHLFDGMESWLPWLTPTETLVTDLLGENAQVILIEPRRTRDRAADLLAEEDDLANALATTWGREKDDTFPRLHAEPERLLKTSQGSSWSIVPTPEGPDAPHIEASGWGPIAGDSMGLTARITGLITEGYRVVVTADSESSADRISNALRDNGLDLPVRASLTEASLRKQGGQIVVSPLHRGCTLPNSKLAIIAESDLTGRRRAHRQARPRKRQSAGFFEDLKPGDYIVHYQHGVGRYAGMVKRMIGGIERDYLLLEYKGGDKLYVPSDQIDAVRQYVGGEAPTLHKMGSSDFAKAKARVRSAVREVAQELVVLYQRRMSAVGHTFPEDTPWQREMEDAFPFVETPDQAKAIDEIKADMESAAPMDRLVCGDVGFGKTEVAIRAAFKAIQDGKQVAVLVPTTLLATQHGNTFADRFSGYPIRIEVLSRFLTAAQAKKVIAGLATGEVDCVIGTHRLLANEVKFKDLGLLVIDEEQRFGVQHKESMKKLRTNVDVLAMSATPIPRTLEMSLVGIRDLSLLQTPPADRQPILTYVGEYDERVAVESIRRELLREGQVFWVHNRVQSIEACSMRLRELVPEARIAVAHGQMDENKLEQTVQDFWEGDYDVLVCTTIIESGIDMPTVNTLVVERADLLGLGQMHQLRGRVGRSGSRAYAYLFHPHDKILSEDAYERLKTIGETTELGSGFKIAMRDLEIRGAGNILGESQSGHISAVGYDLYCQMVTEAVAEMKGEEVKAPAEIKLDVPTDAFLPVDYVTKEELRLEAYRRLAAVNNHDEIADIRTEWEDRYGPVPAPAAALLMVGTLRAECYRLGLREISMMGQQARLAPIALKTSEYIRLGRVAKGAIYKEEIGQLVVPLRKGVDPAVQLVTMLGELIPRPEATT